MERGSVTADKEVTKLIRQIRKWPGWRIEDRTKGYLVFPADKSKAPIPIHKTPSSKRYLANKIGELRRAGAPL
jgi:hypothetical protein